jgi:phosphoglycerate dehydrogenase-like enzyme
MRSRAKHPGYKFIKSERCNQPIYPDHLPDQLIFPQFVAIMLAPTSITSVLVLVPLPDSALDAINAAVDRVHYYPDGDSPAEAQSSAEVIFCSWSGPHGIDSVSQTPKLRHIQVITSGVEQALTHPAVKEAMADERDITISSSVGIHAASIPEHCVAMAINLLHRIDTQLYISRVSVPL